MPRSTAFDENTVLEKARDLFWERGYTATSIQDLEKALDIRRSSIYNTFGGKRELYNRTLKTYQELNQQIIRQILAEVPSVKAGLELLFSRIVGLPVEERKGCYLVNATTELAAIDPEVLGFVANNRNLFVEILQKALEKALRNGELKSNSDPADQARFLFVFYNGLQVVSQTRMPMKELKQAVKRVIDALDWV